MYECKYAYTHFYINVFIIYEVTDLLVTSISRCKYLYIPGSVSAFRITLIVMI